jgi:uncharacterized protein (TIGR02147 family)
VLVTGNKLNDHRLLNFQFTMLKLFMDLYDKRPSSERMISSTTLALSAETFECVRLKLRELRKQLLELSRNEKRPAKVFQLNMNMVSLSE